jgi:hypothetical protein
MLLPVAVLKTSLLAEYLYFHLKLKLNFVIKHASVHLSRGVLTLTKRILEAINYQFMFTKSGFC